MTSNGSTFDCQTLSFECQNLTLNLAKFTDFTKTRVLFAVVVIYISKFKSIASFWCITWGLKMNLFYVSRILKFKSRNHLIVLNRKYIFENNFKMIVKLKKIVFVIFYINLFHQKRMVSDPKMSDALKHRKINELNQTKYRFGILIEFTYNIAFQTGFENSSGNTIYDRVNPVINKTLKLFSFELWLDYASSLVLICFINFSKK